MRALVALALVAAAASPIAVAAQTAGKPADGATPVTAGTPSTAGGQTTNAATALGADTPIETIVASPQGKAVLEKEMASLLAHPMFDSFKAMSLRQLQPYSGGAITDEKLTAVDTALKAIK